MRLLAACIVFLPIIALAQSQQHESDLQTGVEFCRGAAVALYEAERRGGENFVVSPVSAAAAVGMIRTISRRDAFEGAGQPQEQDRFDKDIAAVFEHLARAAGADGVSLNNRVWKQRGIRVTPAVAAALQRHYQAAIDEADLSGEPGASRRSIRRWLDQHAPDVAQDDDDLPITQGALFLVVNATKFRGRWAYPFDKGKNSVGVFHRDGTKGERCVFMHQAFIFPYYEDAHAQVVAMPFIRSDDRSAYSMVIVLPRKDQRFEKFEKGITRDAVQRWLKEIGIGYQERFEAWERSRPSNAAAADEKSWQVRCPIRNVSVSIPRFEVQSRVRIDERALAGNRAESKKSADVDAVQQTRIRVDESGVEADSVTTGGLLGDFEVPAVEFKADRPFVFIIQEATSGAVLFIGRILHAR